MAAERPADAGKNICPARHLQVLLREQTLIGNDRDPVRERASRVQKEALHNAGVAFGCQVINQNPGPFGELVRRGASQEK